MNANADFRSRCLDELSKYRNCGLAGLCRLFLRWIRVHLTDIPPSSRLPRATRRVVITLTSIPSRLPYLRPVLRSLLHQDVVADEVVLALPRFSTRQAAEYSASPVFAGVRVLHCDRDWGPATKLIPTWVERRGSRWADDVLFIMVDDDNVYPPDLVSTLLRWHDRFPDAALGLRGWRLPGSLDWRDKVRMYGTSLDAPREVDVLTSTWGVLVRNDFFDDSLLDYVGFPHDAFFVDDIWFNGHLARRGVARMLVPARHPPLPTRAAGIFDLGSRENADGRRNNRVIECFRADWHR